MHALSNIPMTQIDLGDTTFLITFMPDLNPLVSSIKLVGLLEPLLLREREDGTYQVISGFKRVEALRYLARSEAEAFLYSRDELDDLQALLITVGHNLVRPLNLIERAHILVKLLSFGVDERAVIDRYLPLLGLQPNIRVLMDVAGLLTLEPNIQKYLVARDLSLSTSALFVTLDPEAQRLVISLLEALHPGENRVKEIIIFLREISLRDGVPISSLVSKSDIAKIIADQKTSRPQRLERLRRLLKEIRFPRLTELEKKFADYRRSLSLPPQISFHPPSFFEGEQFTMELRFKDFSGFRKLVNVLHKIIEREPKEHDPLHDIVKAVDI